MPTSSFDYVVLPVLLAASADFSLLTWPIALTAVTQLAETLPFPVSQWVMAVLMTHTYKDLPIRHGDFATLSSVAIGLGTAETMRVRQVWMTCCQKRLAGLTAPEPVRLHSLEDSKPLANPKLDFDELGSDWSTQPPGERVTNPAASTSATNWVNLLSTEAAIAPAHPEPAPLSVVSALGKYRLCHIQGADQQCRLAIQAEGGEYYSFYRRRPSLEKAIGLIEHLRLRGQTAIVTHNDIDFAVWVKRADFPQEVRDNPLWSHPFVPLAEPA